MEEEKEPLTTDDLARVYIRAKMPDGRYASIHGVALRKLSPAAT